MSLWDDQHDNQRGAPPLNYSWLRPLPPIAGSPIKTTANDSDYQTIVAHECGNFDLNTTIHRLNQTNDERQHRTALRAPCIQLVFDASTVTRDRPSTVNATSTLRPNTAKGVRMVAKSGVRVVRMDFLGAAGDCPPLTVSGRPCSASAAGSAASNSHREPSTAASRPGLVRNTVPHLVLPQSDHAARPHVTSRPQPTCAGTDLANRSKSPVRAMFTARGLALADTALDVAADHGASTKGATLQHRPVSPREAALRRREFARSAKEADYKEKSLLRQLKRLGCSQL